MALISGVEHVFVSRGNILALCLTISVSIGSATAAGPDVIVGDIPNMDRFGHVGTISALAMATTSCNVGDTPLKWKFLPYNTHPVIAQNFYRLKDGRLTQIGMAWLKHGFFAEQGPVCFGDCQPDFTGATLGVHCSDPYSADFNAGGGNYGLGRRSEVNPVTGNFDGSTANKHTGHVHNAISHRIQVQDADLANPGARYFAEAIYIAADDIAAGNVLNSTGHREFSVSGTVPNWFFSPVGTTFREQLAVNSWTGASRVNIDLPVDGRIIVMHKATDLGGGQFRYDYAVMNYNSDRGVRRFSVPVGALAVTNIGFSAPSSHDEGYSNAAWPVTIAGGRIEWACPTYATDANANAVRWGTMYNFWFEASAAPVSSTAQIGRFKPGFGPLDVYAAVVGPMFEDCNNNGNPDSTDIETNGIDCDGNGILDVCELAGADCNADGIPDKCQMATGDCNGNGMFDSCETGALDCDNNGVPDNCELAGHDCNGNGIHDACELAGADCNANGVPDTCESDCDANGVIDACQADCNANGAADICDVQGASGGPRTYPSGPVNILTRDNDFVIATINCPLAGPVVDVNLTLNLMHTFTGDIQLRLKHNTTDVLLYDRTGGNGQNFINTTLDDEAPNGIQTEQAPYTGAFNPVGDLSDFDGQSAAGLWTLVVDDNRVQDSGVLLNWSLTITVPPGLPTSPDVNSNGIPDECDICPCKGDMNADHALNGRDIKLFVQAVSGAYVACADMNNSGALNSADVTLFVNKLLAPNPPCP